MALISLCKLSSDARVHAHHWVVSWSLLCWLLAHYSLWVSRMRIATPHLVTKWPPILSLRTVLPSQNLLSPGLPSRSSRPGWLPRPRMHLFGQDWLLVCWTHHWCRCEQQASPGSLQSPLRPRSSQSPLQSPLRPRSSQSPLQSPLRPRSSQSPLQSPLRPRSSQSPLQSPLRPRSSQSPLQSPLRPRSSQSPLQSPLRPRSSQSPLQSPLRPRSSQSPLQSPLRPRSSQSPLQSPLRPRSSQSLALRVLSWFRPAPQSPCWPCPAHLRLRWFLPVQRPRDSAHPEYPLTFAPPGCLPEVVDFPFVGGSHPPVLTETPDLPWPMRSPDPSWLPEAPDLPWPLKLPASVPETKCALSPSCVSISSRSQSQPGISAPPWRAPAPLWRSPVLSALPWWAPVSSAPPWWVPVSSAPPWWAPVSSAPPWWASDLPESPHVSADLPESPHVSADLPESPHVSADLPESPHVSADLPESPHVSADLPKSPHVSADLPESPHVSTDLPESPHVSADLPESPHTTVVYPVSLHVPAVSSALPWWAPVSLAPHEPGPPFHLRSTALLDFALCKASGSRS